METLYNVIKDITIHTVETKEYSTIRSNEDFKLYDIIVLSGSHVKLAATGVLDANSIEKDILRRMQKPIHDGKISIVFLFHHGLKVKFNKGQFYEAAAVP